MKLRYITVFLSSLAMYLVILSNFSLAELPYGTPKANKDVEGLVPFDIVQKIALKRAKKNWGQVSQGIPIPCADADGNIVAYFIPFVTGVRSFPSDSEILSTIQYGRKIVNEGFEACNDEDKTLLRGFVRDKKNLNNLPAPPIVMPAFNIADGKDDGLDGRLLNKEARKLGLKKMIGAGSFGTVVVAARYDRFPVPLYMDSLPTYLYHGDLALKKAEEMLADDTLRLERIYFLEDIRSEYFEFSSSNQDTVLMHAGSLRIEPAEMVLQFRGKKRILDPAETSAIEDAWNKMEREIE